MNTTCLGSFIAVFVSWSLIASECARADRLDDYKKLEAEYAAAEQKFYEAPQPEEVNTANRIRGYEAWPGWQYLPQFLALAEANPSDEAAYRACLWILDRTRGATDRAMFGAEKKAWRIIAAHHAHGDNVPKLCLQAVDIAGPAQEAFLRSLLKQEGRSPEHVGFATLALAETLAQRVEYISRLDTAPAPNDEFVNYLKQRRSPDWDKELTSANSDKFKAESSQLFRVVLERYSDVPCTISMPYFRHIATLGEKAKKSLHALEHLTVGVQAPDIIGKDLQGNALKLEDYRGRVVLLSFWFTGCGPCMAMIPEEKELVKKFKDRPFALLAVSTDSDLEMAQMTAKEHGIDWPCWFDGENGPIARDYNVLSWPTFYVLDKNGRISAKVRLRHQMEFQITKLLNQNE